MLALVTGANGFLGDHLVKALLADGVDVRALLLAGTSAATLEGTGVDIRWGDLGDRSALLSACQGVARVFHLAAKVGDYGPASEYFRANVQGTENLLWAAAEAGVQRLVFMSSLTVHAFRPLHAATEDTPCDAVRYPYALSKVAAEQCVATAQRRGDLQTVIVRPAVVPYGPGDRRAFIPLARACQNGWLPLVDGGQALTCTIYAADLARGLLQAASTPAAAGQTYILADPQPVRWRDYFAAICHALGCRSPRLSLPSSVLLPAASAVERVSQWLQREPPLTHYRLNLLRHDFWFSAARARRELGFVPTVDLPEGLRRTVAWYRDLPRP